MRPSGKISLFLASVVALAGCATSRNILYMQDIEEVALKNMETAYEAVIKKDDRLTIVVSGPDKTVTAPYNLTLGELNGSTSMSPENSTIGYLVDANGEIDFPILGKIHVEGMTRNQLVNYLTSEIGKDVKNPIVFVSFRNYKITVLGEVRAPGTYSFDSEKTNILQALGRAGDLNITAKRDGILLLREINGEMVHYKIDLRKAHMLDSPTFYLQQNDVLYIPPSSTRVASGTAATGIWSIALSSITTMLSTVSAIIAFTNVNKEE